MVYPNPATHNFVVSWENQARFDVEIYSVLGELMHYEQVNNSRTQISTAHLPMGVYIVKTISGDVSKKVMLVVK